MATTQYIGARYVPKFFENSATNDSTWAANTAYEPLTIVTWNGNSYTSKKAVPSGVGNPSANPTYWASTGMFNAQVESIREQLEELTADFNLSDLNHVVFIGDSYVQANSLGSDQYQRFSSVISRFMGWTEHNYATGGSDFLSGGDSGETFMAQLQNAYAGMTEEEIAKTGYVFVCGGRNMPYNSPSATLSDYNTAVSSCLNQAKTYYPNANIVFVPMLWSAEPLNNTYMTTLQWLTQCAANGVWTTINDAYLVNMGHYGNILTDNVHWNVAGHLRFANFIMAALFGGAPKFGPIFTTLSVSNGTGSIKMVMDEKTMDGYIKFTPDSAIVFGGYIRETINLNPNYGFLNGQNKVFQMVGRDGSSVNVQVGMYYANNNINFTLQALGTMNAGVEYYGNFHILNGLAIAY